MTAKPKTASIRCPAIDNPAGVGDSRMASSTVAASINPQFPLTQPGRQTDSAALLGDTGSDKAMIFPPEVAGSLTSADKAPLRWINPFTLPA
jgi:hypothetical protein